MDRRGFIGSMGAGLSLMALPGDLFAEIPGESNEQRDRRLSWWREARFGMFIHWGVYAVAAGVWKGKRVPSIGEWIMHTARIPVKEYETLAPEFNPVKFDAREWARIAKNAGMKYMVITSKHHDGFCMFDSKLTTWDIMDATPFKRDVIRELSQACRDEGVRFGLYHSILDWHHPDQDRDFNKYMAYMEGQVTELLTNYGPICSLFYDGDWIRQWNKSRATELEALTRKLQPAIIINNRVGKRSPLAALPGISALAPQDRWGDYDTPEQFIPKKPPARDWETCMTMNDTWGYKQYDDNWKPASDLVRNLIDIAGKGGNFLLNVGPTAEGVIPEPSIERLAAMGQWLQVNGDSIYGTTAGPLHDLKWGRTTQKPGRIFLHVFDWPGEELMVAGINQPIKKAHLLADPSSAALSLTDSAAGLTIKLPAKAPDPVASVVALEL
ncbi:MAG TPA: alpha-L-fucosidase [bacterium]|nr:alpha-L-fucosidase [bacterium]